MCLTSNNKGLKSKENERMFIPLQYIAKKIIFDKLKIRSTRLQPSQGLKEAIIEKKKVGSDAVYEKKLKQIF